MYIGSHFYLKNCLLFSLTTENYLNLKVRAILLYNSIQVCTLIGSHKTMLLVINLLESF